MSKKRIGWLLVWAGLSLVWHSLAGMTAGGASEFALFMTGVCAALAAGEVLAARRDCRRRREFDRFQREFYRSLDEGERPLF